MSPPVARPVSAPPRVRDRLRTSPDGALPVVHRGRYAVYLDLAGWCVGVVGSEAAQVPCALRLRTPDLFPLTGESAYLRRGVLHLDGAPLVVGRIVDVHASRLDSTAARNTADSATAQATPPAAVTEFVASSALPALPALPSRLDPSAVRRLVGGGDGLTPFGDDLLCGWLATHRAAGVATPSIDTAVRDLLPRTTLLSATLLDCAMRGEVLPEFAAYLAAIGTADEPARAATLIAVGHSSGAGMLYGARLALAELRTTNGAAA